MGREGDFLYGGRAIVYALLAATDPVSKEILFGTADI